MKKYNVIAICILLVSNMVISASYLDRKIQPTCVSDNDETKTEYADVESNQPSDCDFMHYIHSVIGWFTIKKPQFTRDGILKDAVATEKKYRCPKKYN